MKFITSRVISPNKVKSLMEIIAEKEAEVKEQKMVMAKTSEKKRVKTASVKPEKKIKKQSSIKNTKKSKIVSIKEVKVSSKKAGNKIGMVWKKLNSQASLSSEDRNFLIQYFNKYYPADYAEALIAQY